MSAEVLNSWKEIAVYTGRGIRTIQRRERELGCPVRRPREKSRSAVIAIKTEIDRWFRMSHRPTNGSSLRDRHFETQTRLLRNAETLEARASRLVDCCGVLKREIDRAVEIGSRLQISCQSSRARRMDAVVSRSEKYANMDRLKQQAQRATDLVTAIQTSVAAGGGRLEGKMVSFSETRPA